MPKKLQEVEAKVEAPKAKVDLSSLVNADKADRARVAVGLASGKKPDDACVKLAAEARNLGLSVEEAVLHVYKGLGGLVDQSRANKNRANEKEAARKRASR